MKPTPRFMSAVTTTGASGEQPVVLLVLSLIPAEELNQELLSTTGLGF